MMTTYGYGFTEPQPVVVKQEPNYLLWAAIIGGLWWAYKKGGLKKALAVSLASPAEEIAAGGSLL